jgi:hypothetical protein
VIPRGAAMRAVSKHEPDRANRDFPGMLLRSRAGECAGRTTLAKTPVPPVTAHQANYAATKRPSRFRGIENCDAKRLSIAWVIRERRIQIKACFGSHYRHGRQGLGTPASSGAPPHGFREHSIENLVAADKMVKQCC